jgi:amino acid adenylation domain-containing protein
MRSLFSQFSCWTEAQATSQAIVSEEESLTYEDLQQLCKRTAAYLSECGVVEGERVGLIFSPSVDFIIVLLACLKLGVSYVPLYLDSPVAYLIEIIEEAKLKKIVIEDSASIKRELLEIDQTQAIVFDRSLLPISLLPHSEGKNPEAYTIFTSGTTGSPKGAVITQKNLLSLFAGTEELFNFQPGDRVPFFHDLSFDFSVWEIFSALLYGATLWIPRRSEKKGLSDYFAALVENRATRLNFTPFVFYLFSQWVVNTDSDLSCVKSIVLGGAAINISKCKTWFSCDAAKNIQLINMYGITEATVHATFKQVDESLLSCMGSNIGQPLSCVEAAIMTDQGHISEEGELWLGGDTISAGYLHQQNLTEQKFTQKVIEGCRSTRWFRTGDRVARSENGDLLYLGRKDDMCKVRGYRVSLIEIEQRIADLGGVSSVALASEDSYGTRQLVAYIVPYHKKTTELELRNQWIEAMPIYMVPSRIVFCETFPLTKNGKVDIESLTKNASGVCVSLEKVVGLEDRVKAIWSKLLNRSDIDSSVNFFDAGGNSLLLVKLQFELNSLFEKSFSVIDLLSYPNITAFIRKFEEELQ